MAYRFVDRKAQDLRKSWQMTSLYANQFNIPIVHHAQVTARNLKQDKQKTPPTSFSLSHPCISYQLVNFNLRSRKECVAVEWTARVWRISQGKPPVCKEPRMRSLIGA
jgi:hypothetical protein